MNKRAALLVIVMLFSIIAPGTALNTVAAGGTVTRTYTATADTMELKGQAEYNGIYDNNGDGFLYVGMSNNDGFVNVRNRMAALFNLGAPEGTIVSVELVLTVATVLRVPNHTLYAEVRGSAANALDHSFTGTFPSVDTNSSYADKFTAKSTVEVPMDTYLQDQTITLNVKSAVDAFTDGSDRNITLLLNGNEADADSGRFLFYALESSNPAFRPQLVVTYETGTVNNPPVGSFTIVEGSATSAGTVNLSVTGSDPDAGDSVTYMRFANSAANLSAASWLPFSNTATFSLTGGDGSKTIYMQLRDSNNGISANSSQTILLDQTAPTGTLIINDGATWTGSNTVKLYSSSSTINNTIIVDTIAPVITNVVNNKAYNSTVAPQFTEGSGLLNGNPYSSGTEITEEDAYTLIVTDSAGNSATVTFVIDRTAPVITGVDNGGLYNRNVTVTFGEGTATLNGATFSSGSHVTFDGVYTLVVTDAAGNVTTVSFEIDKEAPTVSGIANNGSYKGAVTVSFNEGTATLNGAVFVSGTEIEQEGTYTLVVTDGAGNVATVSFEIDKTAPVVTGVQENGNYNEAVTVTFNEGTATLNGMAFSNGTEIDQDGSYTLVVSDEAGNITTVSFKIDTEAPLVSGITAEGIYKINVTPSFIEGTATLNGAVFVSGTEIEQEGTYTLVVTDGAGNVATVSFEIDKTAPEVTGVQDNRNYNEAVTVTFNEGTATLNGAAFTSGTEIEQEGAYTLVVTDAAGNVTTVGFEVDKTAPKVTGISDGGVYNTKVTAEFSEGTATLNGVPYTTGTEIEHAGSYTLLVTDKAGNVTTIIFEINSKGSNNASLSSLALGGITLDQAVSSSVYSYTATVPNSTSVTQVTYTTADSHATVELQLNRRTVINPIYLSEGTNNISVIVTAQDGTKQTYTIKVTRLTDGGSSEGSSGGSSSGTTTDTTAPGTTIPTKPESKPKPEVPKPTIFQKNVSYSELLSFLENRLAQLKSNPATPELTDISNHWSKDTIRLLATLGFISGYEDGSFKPDTSITRAEFAKIITTIFKFNPGSKPSAAFSDIDNHWARESIYNLVSQGILAGYTDNTFKPDKPITRAEIIAIISRIVDLNAVSKGTPTLTFTDIEGAWNVDQILAAVQAGIVQGRNSTTFVPNDIATRAEACAIILRTIKLDPSIQALLDQLK